MGRGGGGKPGILAVQPTPNLGRRYRNNSPNPQHSTNVALPLSLAHIPTAKAITAGARETFKIFTARSPHGSLIHLVGAEAGRSGGGTELGWGALADSPYPQPPDPLAAPTS